MLGRLIAGLILLLLSQSILAKNPIGWVLNESFPEQVFFSGSNYSVTYTFTNQLPFQLIKPIQIQKSSNATTEFTYQDQCSGITLMSG